MMPYAWKRTMACRMMLPYTVWYVSMFVLLMTAWYLDWLSRNLREVLILALLIIPYSAYRLGPVRRFRKRLSEGDFCMFCEYSFQGHGKEGVCPECGESIALSLRILRECRNAGWWERRFF